MYNMDKYKKIIETICEIKDIKRGEVFKIIQDREYKYLLFLLLKKYNCDNPKKINEDFCINNKRSIRYNIRKGKEKLLINKDFRNIYFEIKKRVDSIN